MSNFAENFLKLLKLNNLTLRQLAERVKISSSQLSKYVSGNYEPSLKNALSISYYFDCTLDYMFGLDNFKKRIQLNSEVDISKFIERFETLIKLRNTNIYRISTNCFVNRNGFYNWKKLKIFPKVSILAKLAKELNTTIEYLIGRTDLLEVDNEI